MKKSIKELKIQLLEEVRKKEELLLARKKALRIQYEYDVEKCDETLDQLKVKENAFKSLKQI